MVWDFQSWACSSPFSVYQEERSVGVLYETVAEVGHIKICSDSEEYLEAPYIFPVIIISAKFLNRTAIYIYKRITDYEE